ncbi:MAG: triose-phosphate isomerase [Patescibacteria group bacterium]|nr:triose-phosphate isomerase [Patescibacteria group bacterium]
MRKPLVVANWKMNPSTLAKAKKLFNSIKEGIRKVRNVEIVICPPFLYLPQLVEFLYRCRKSQLNLGAQDCFWKEKGAFTGEISPLMLKNIGCQYVIIGHSERRRHFNETDEMINKKIKAALKAKLKPIFCVGETGEEREREETSKILKSQIENGLNKISKKEIKNIVIAYEPVWAIGTGKPCDPDEAMRMSLLIRKIIAQIYSRSISEALPTLYGGSVDSKNAAKYIKEARMNGLLVGGASLSSKEFIKILKAIS